jgi:hypothetical protein
MFQCQIYGWRGGREDCRGGGSIDLKDSSNRKRVLPSCSNIDDINKNKRNKEKEEEVRSERALKRFPVGYFLWRQENHGRWVQKTRRGRGISWIHISELWTTRCMIEYPPAGRFIIQLVLYS